jgi:hypothetical protein
VVLIETSVMSSCLANLYISNIFVNLSKKFPATLLFNPRHSNIFKICPMKLYGYTRGDWWGREGGVTTLDIIIYRIIITDDVTTTEITLAIFKFIIRITIFTQCVINNL